MATRRPNSEVVAEAVEVVRTSGLDIVEREIKMVSKKRVGREVRVETRLFRPQQREPCCLPLGARTTGAPSSRTQSRYSRYLLCVDLSCRHKSVSLNCFVGVRVLSKTPCSLSSSTKHSRHRLHRSRTRCHGYRCRLDASTATLRTPFRCVCVSSALCSQVFSLVEEQTSQQRRSASLLSSA